MHTPTRSLPLARPLLLAAVGLGLMAPAVRAQENQLEINVRPSVVDKTIMWTRDVPSPEGGHSKIYGILSVKEVKAEHRLIRAVNENAIIELLSAEMNKNGFKLYAPGTRPDIVITVSYGRGELTNPYIKGGGEQGGSSTIGAATSAANAESAESAVSHTTYGQQGPAGNDSGATAVTITGGFATQLMDERSPGFEAKLQKAAQEKLYLRVVAWAYPNGPEAIMLWKTTIVVDDPDHRDLNAIAAAMLEAGAPYFDKEIREREADIFKPLPNTQIKLGTPEVVPPKSK